MAAVRPRNLSGARREHSRRLERHQTRVRTAHPRLGGLILALADDPQHVRAWQTGAVGEEEFGSRLSGCSGPELKVLHDRKLPRSTANIDHLAFTPEAVWILDAKRYKGKVETRGGGLFSRRAPELYVGGRNQTKLVEGVKRQVATVRSLAASLASEVGMTAPPDVRGALVFINAEFGLFTTPFTVDDVWVGWGKSIRKRLARRYRARSRSTRSRRGSHASFEPADREESTASTDAGPATPRDSRDDVRSRSRGSTPIGHGGGPSGVQVTMPTVRPRGSLGGS
jgi:hypothetical protein